MTNYWLDPAGESRLGEGRPFDPPGQSLLLERLRQIAKAELQAWRKRQLGIGTDRSVGNRISHRDWDARRLLSSLAQTMKIRPFDNGAGRSAELGIREGEAMRRGWHALGGIPLLIVTA